MMRQILRFQSNKCPVCREQVLAGLAGLAGCRDHGESAGSMGRSMRGGDRDLCLVQGIWLVVIWRKHGEGLESFLVPGA